MQPLLFFSQFLRIQKLLFRLVLWRRGTAAAVIYVVPSGERYTLSPTWQPLTAYSMGNVDIAAMPLALLSQNGILSVSYTHLTLPTIYSV